MEVPPTLRNVTPRSAPSPIGSPSYHKDGPGGRNKPAKPTMGAAVGSAGPGSSEAGLGLWLLPEQVYAHMHAPHVLSALCHPRPHSRKNQPADG